MRYELAKTAIFSPQSLTYKGFGANQQDLALAFYENSMFSGDKWNVYKTQNELYKHTRLVFNPVPLIVDFYIDNIWSKGTDNLVTPIDTAPNDLVLPAVGQIDQWSNWRTAQVEVKRNTTIDGGCLVEVLDDVERGKVLHKVIKKELVTGLNLNVTNDIQSYAIEYEVREKDETYRFGKIVDKEKYQYFKDDKPFDYGQGAEVYHNFGFCPAVWFKHSTDNRSAFDDYSRLADLNSLLSHLRDNIHKEIESAILVGMENPDTIEVLTGGSKSKDGSINQSDPRLERVLLAVKGSVSLADLSGDLKLNEAYPYAKDGILNYADEYPEIEYKQILKNNGQLSGRALERLLTPAQNKLDRVSALYDEQLIKLRQMQLAIAGWRTKNGWQGLSNQQQLFSSFGLDSYSKGDLSFTLKPSLLLELTDTEQEEVLQMKANRASTLKDILPESEIYKILGYSEDETILLIAEKAKEKEIVQPVQPIDQGLPIGA